MKPGDRIMGPVGVLTVLEVGEYFVRVSYVSASGDELTSLVDHRKIISWPKLGDMSGPVPPESDIKKGEL